MSVVASILSVFDPKGVQQAEKAFGNLEKRLKTAVGVAALAQFGKAAIAAADESAKSAARIQQIAKQMGLFGSETAKVTARLTDYAGELSKSVGVDDEIIQNTQAKLLTFADLAKTADTLGGAFDRATRAALDLAAAGFGEAESNAVMLGKALQDPIKGLTALTRAGVTFTDEQRKQIAVLVEAGKKYEAQKVILAAIEQQVGGTAEATATASDKLAVAWDSLLETVGRAVMPAFEALVNALIPIIDAFAALPEEMQTAILVAVALGAAYLKLRTILQSLKIAASTANVAFAAFAVVTEAYFLLVGNGADDAAAKVGDFISEVDRLNDAQALRQFEDAWVSVRDNLDLGITDLAWWDVTGDRQAEVGREALRKFVADFARGNLEAAKRVRDLTFANEGASDSYRYLSSAIYDEEAAQANLKTNTEGLTVTEEEAKAAADELAAAHKRVEDAARGRLDAQLALISQSFALEQADRDVGKALEEYMKVVAETADPKYSGNAERDKAEALDGFYEAAIRAAAAADAQAKSVAEAAGITYTAADATEVQKKKLEEIAKTLAPDSPLRKQLLEYIGILENRIPKKITTDFYASISVNWDTATLARFPGLIQRRAAGGPVAGGTPYMVGEVGPELFVPATAGKIISNRALTSGGNAGGRSVNVTVNGALDPVQVARQIRRLLNDEQTRYDLAAAV